jgi:putative flippase GtrA
MRPAIGGRVFDLRSLARFIGVGVSNTLINLAVFSLVMRALPHRPWSYPVAQLASYTPGVAWSYFWNRRWSFESSEGHRKLLWRFVASQVVFAVFSGVCIEQLVVRSGLSATVCWLIVSAVMTVLNYLVMRHVIFPRSDEDSPGSLRPAA